MSGRRRLGPEATAALYRGHGELFRDEYREGIWRSKINLSFLTHSNHDEFVHKSFEIAACEGFLLAERSPGHLARFVEDEEAVFFEGIDECVAKIRRYLPDEAARARIAAAGRRRADTQRLPQRCPGSLRSSRAANHPRRAAGRRNDPRSAPRAAVADYRPQVCIVGAGAAGICLAVELAKRGKNVMLLEGGGRDVEDAAQEPYRSEVIGHVHRGIHSGRFRAHGGTTTRWGGQILELNTEDFERRDWIAESGWPFSRSALQPFYKRALAFEGLAGVLEDDNAVWRALDFPPPSFFAMQSYLRAGAPSPTSLACIAARSKPAPTSRSGCTRTRLSSLIEGDAVRALRIRTQQGIEATRAGRRIRLLHGHHRVHPLLPAAPRRRSPMNHSGLLGHHFQDHIDANAAKVIPRDRRKFAQLFDNIFLRGYKYHPKLRSSPTNKSSRAS